MPQPAKRFATTDTGKEHLRCPPMAEFCESSDGEEKAADFVNDLIVAAGRPAGEALEGGQNEVGSIEAEDAIASFEVVGFRLGFEFSVLHRGAPFAAPLARNLDPIGHVYP